MRVQRLRRTSGSVVVYCLGLAVIMSGCSDGGDSATATVNQPISSVVPKDIQNRSYKFLDGMVFHPALARKTVMLTFGDFGSTISAPFALVSFDGLNGFRASGLVTRVNFYTLSIQESTFQTVKGAAQGPQVGSQILLDFFGSDPSGALGARQVDPNTQQPIVGGAAVNSNGPVCNNTVGTNNGMSIPQALGTLSSGSCLTVNGNIAFDLVPPKINPTNPNTGSDYYVVTVQQGQEDLIVTLTLTHPPGISQLDDQGFGIVSDLDTADFNMNIYGVDSQGTQSIRSCTLPTSPEICSVALLSTDRISALQIIVFPFFGSGDYTLDVSASRLITNRAACGNPLAEIEPNNTFAMPQNVGTVTAGSCLRISGSLSTVEGVPVAVEDVDLYNLTTVGNDLLIASLTLDNPNDNRAMVLYDPNNNNQILLECRGSITPQVCVLTGLQSQTRNLDLAVVPFTTSTSPQANYTLDIISAGVPPYVTPPPGETCTPTPASLVGPARPCRRP